MISPGGLTKLNDVTSPYNGWFYITFKDNQSILLTFKDQCGNKASATITVDSIDTSIPSLSITWMPYYISPEGEAQYDIPSDRMTNTDVFATLVFDRPIRRIDTSISFDYAMTFTDVTDNSYDNLFTLVYGSDTATVTFKENDVVLRLTITALNGKSITEYIFGPYIIDKIPPNITQIIQYSYNTGGTIPVSALIKLTPDEDVYMIGGKTPEKVFAQGEEIRFTVFEKGIYSYRFTDMAGNMRVVNVNVDQDMDRTIPVITIDKGPDDPTKNDVLVKVSMNEAGTIKISGITHPVAKDQVLTVNIANNGSYPVIGTDNAGNQNITTFVIGFIDKIKPEITFMRSASPIRQNSDPGDLTAILEDKSYLVSDNMSAPEKITVTYDKTFVKLGTPGTYPVLYTAVDETGNQGTATRFIKVYSEKDLEVLLNGQKTEREGTLVIITKQVTLSVTNPIGDEPYTVYIRSGLKTEGQMKTGTIIEPDENGVFTVPSNGFYTLYIVTQSRQTYITRIYVEIGG